MTYHWNTPIRYVRGIGPQRAKELVKIGISTVGQLLERHPLSYIYPGVIPIKDAKEGMVVIKAKIKEIKTGWGSTVEAVLADDTGACKAIWYTHWVVTALRTGMTATFYGKFKGGILSQPRWTTVEATMNRVYGGQYGETHHDTIRAALNEILAKIELPTMYDGGNRVGVFRIFHFPHDKYEQQAALHALKFNEAICLQLALLEKRKKRDAVQGGVIWI